MWHLLRLGAIDESAASVFRTEQTRNFFALIFLLKVLTCNLCLKKKWPKHTESGEQSFCIA